MFLKSITQKKVVANKAKEKERERENRSYLRDQKVHLQYLLYLLTASSCSDVYSPLAA